MYNPAGSEINGALLPIPCDASGVKKLFALDSIAKTLVVTIVFRGPLTSAFTTSVSPFFVLT